MSTDTPAAIVADLVKALEPFVKMEKSISADVSTAHKLRGDGASDFMREDDSDMRDDLRKAFSAARAALARAKQLDLDRAQVKPFYGSLSGPTNCKSLFKGDVEVLCIPLRPSEATDDTRKEPV